MAPAQKDELRKMAGIRMRPSLIERMRKQAEAEHRSLANMVEVACEAYLQAVEGKSKIND